MSRHSDLGSDEGLLLLLLLLLFLYSTYSFVQVMESKPYMQKRKTEAHALLLSGDARWSKARRNVRHEHPVCGFAQQCTRGEELLTQYDSLARYGLFSDGHWFEKRPCGVNREMLVHDVLTNNTWGLLAEDWAVGNGRCVECSSGNYKPLWRRREVQCLTMCE